MHKSSSTTSSRHFWLTCRLLSSLLITLLVLIACNTAITTPESDPDPSPPPPVTQPEEPANPEPPSDPAPPADPDELEDPAAPDDDTEPPVVDDNPTDPDESTDLEDNPGEGDDNTPTPEDPELEDPQPEDPQPEDPQPEDPQPEDPNPGDPELEDPEPEGPDPTLPPPYTPPSNVQPLVYPLRITENNPDVTVAFNVIKPINAVTAEVTLRVWSADVADEGQFRVNGSAPIMLFGDQRVSGNIQATIVLETPASQWVNGTNYLNFTWLRTFGYWVDRITVVFRSANDGFGVSEPFTIVAIPDTQNYLCSICPLSDNKWHPETFPGQTQWIVDNKNNKNIAFVTHLGDIVETANQLIEWELADEAMSILDGRVPYAVAMGDHDFYPEEFRDPAIPDNTTYFKQFFGRNRYERYDWFVGGAANDLSHAQVFTAGGRQFLHISLEWEAPDAAINWAIETMRRYPGMPTIVTTHAYLNSNTRRHGHWIEAKLKDGRTDPLANSGRDIYEKLVRPHPQIFMVLNAHYHGGIRNVGPEDEDGEWHQISYNVSGSAVYEMVSNYQNFQNGGDGWLRTIEFIPGGGAGGLDRMQMRTYSPTRNQYRTGPLSQFYFDFDFAERFNNP